ncbi:MAG: hypothetical protein KA129_08315 [Microthrixaceae bacterium]|nr:hypothetical protein [Microthrixaceae bacterium]
MSSLVALACGCRGDSGELDAATDPPSPLDATAVPDGVQTRDAPSADARSAEDAASPDGARDPDACELRTWFIDLDSDGHGDPTTSTARCDVPLAWVLAGDDCDDACVDCHPGGIEACDAAMRDEDCDGTANSGCACVSGATRPCGATTDEGACVIGVERCVDGAWAACDGGVGPRAETCDGVDEDCDGTTDGSTATCPEVPNATQRCVSGACAIDACEAGWEDCDRDPVNGCEGRVGSCCPAGCAWGCSGDVCRSAVQVAIGRNFACALRDDGRVACWGDDGFGVLGDGSEDPRPLPGLVPGVTDAIGVTAGWYAVCALRTGGRLSCWGRNSAQEFGLGRDGPDELSTPTELTFPFPVVDAAIGLAHSCVVLGDGSVWCSGDNNFGQLGDGTTLSRRSFTRVVGVAGATALSTYESSTCALRADDRVSCWGSCSGHACGVGMYSGVETPMEMTGITNAVQVTVGDAHTCVRLADATMACVGRNAEGQAGIGTTESPISAAVATPGMSAVALVSAFQATYSVTASGQAWTWGPPQRRGDESLVHILAPTRSPNLDRMTDIDAGAFLACGVRDGAVYCWGVGGLLADGVFSDSRSPVRTIPP